MTQLSTVFNRIGNGSATSFDRSADHGQPELADVIYRICTIPSHEQASDPVLSRVYQRSSEMARRAQKNERGFLIPLTTPVRMETRSLTSITGTGAIPTIVEPAYFIDLLRARSVLAGLGARILNLPNESGQVSLPRISTTATVSWLAEGAAPPAITNPVTDNVIMSQKTISASVEITEKMLKSSSDDFRDFVVQDIAGAMAVAIDQAAINGTGTANDPKGLLNVAGIPVQSIGATPTRAKLISMEQTAGNANADGSPTARMGWATNPDVRAKLKGIDASTSGGKWLWDDDDRVIGRPAVSSTNVPAQTLIYGNWYDLILNAFTGLDVIVNPYQYSLAGVTRISCFMDVDVQVTHVNSFVKCTDLTTP
jgi:HK97 family phage major capsid protein